MKQFQLAKQNYIDKDKNPAHYIQKEFDTYDEALEYVRYNYLDNHDFTQFDNADDFIESGKVIDENPADFKYPICISDDNILLTENGEQPNILELSANTENYVRIFNLLDDQDFDEVFEHSDLFDTDEDGVFSFCDVGNHYYIDDEGRTQEEECPQDEQKKEFEESLFDMLLGKFNYMYSLVRDKQRQHDDRVDFENVGIGYADRVIFSDETIGHFDTIQDEFSTFCADAGVHYLIYDKDDRVDYDENTFDRDDADTGNFYINDCDNDKLKALKLFYTGTITKEQYQKFTRDGVLISADSPGEVGGYEVYFNCADAIEGFYLDNLRGDIIGP